MKSYAVTAFYRFFSLSAERLQSLPLQLACLDTKFYACGLILISSEGVNGTVAVPEQYLGELKQVLKDLCGELVFKDSLCRKKPFKRYKVKLKQEIVAIGDDNLVPGESAGCYLVPAKWNAVLESSENFSLIDVRNRYEIELGNFPGAINPQTDKFNQFPEFVKSCGIPKSQKILMYCTGGIRCEKASLEMQRQGYQHVYQLAGGILHYLEESPNRHFNGECFVFDKRVAVDQELKPSARFALCPHCGDPGDLRLQCRRCNKDTIVCRECAEVEQQQTCSKDCRHHFLRKGSSIRAGRSCNFPQGTGQ